MGFETIAWALSAAFFHIIGIPVVQQKLQEELSKVINHTVTLIDVIINTQLPYLFACVKEAIRLSCGSSTRPPCVSQEVALKYKRWEIPRGIPVSMSIIDMHHDERILPDSEGVRSRTMA